MRKRASSVKYAESGGSSDDDSDEEFHGF